MASSLATHACVFVCDASPGLSGASAETPPVVVVGSGEKPNAIVPRVSPSASASVSPSVSHTPAPSLTLTLTPTPSLMGTASPTISAIVAGVAAGASSVGTDSGGGDNNTSALPSWAQGIDVLCAAISTITVLVCMYGAVSRLRLRLRRRGDTQACARIVVHACATLAWLWSTVVHHHMATDSTTVTCSRVSPWLMWVCGESLAAALLCVKLAPFGTLWGGGGARVVVSGHGGSARAIGVWVAAATIVGSAIVLASGLSIDALVDRSLVENEDCSETAVASVGIGSMLVLHVVVVWVVLLALGRNAGGRFVSVLSTCTAFAGTFLWWALTYGGEETSTGHHTLTIVCVCAAGAALFGTRLASEDVAGKVRPLWVEDAPVSPLQEEEAETALTTGRSSVAWGFDDDDDDSDGGGTGCGTDGVKRWTMPDVPRLDLSATRPVPPLRRRLAQDDNDSDFDLLEYMHGAITTRATSDDNDDDFAERHSSVTQFPDVTPRGPLVVSSLDEDDDPRPQPPLQQRRYQRPPTRRPPPSGLGSLEIRRGAAPPLAKAAPPDILSLSDPVVEEEDHCPVVPLPRQDLSLQRTSPVAPAQSTSISTESLCPSRNDVMSLDLMTTTALVERPVAPPRADIADQSQPVRLSVGGEHDADGIVFLDTSRSGAAAALRLETLDDDESDAVSAPHHHHHSGTDRVTRRRRVAATAADTDDNEDLLPGAISDRDGRLLFKM